MLVASDCENGKHKEGIPYVASKAMMFELATSF